MFLKLLIKLLMGLCFFNILFFSGCRNSSKKKYDSKVKTVDTNLNTEISTRKNSIPDNNKKNKPDNNSSDEVALKKSSGEIKTHYDSVSMRKSADSLGLMGASMAPPPKIVATYTDSFYAKKINNLLVFHIEDTMQVNQTYKATLALAKNEEVELLKGQVLQSAGTRHGKLYVDTSLKVAPTMKASLKDLSPLNDRNFDIRLLGDGNEIQDIDSLNEQKAFWEWSLIPLKEGQHKLELVVEIVVNRSRKIFLPSKTIPVIIHSESVSFGQRLGRFFGKNWQWMLGAVILPLFIAWLNIRNRQKHQIKRKRRIFK